MNELPGLDYAFRQAEKVSYEAMSCSEIGLLGLRLQTGGEERLLYAAQSLDYELPGLDYGFRQAENSYELLRGWTTSCPVCSEALLVELKRNWLS